MKHTLRFLLSLVAGMVLTSICAFAQVTTSSISGKITDKDGAVQGAPVVAVHQASGNIYYSITDKNGSYRINNLTPGGPYTVTVEVLGYRKYEATGVYAPLGEIVTLNTKLEDEALNLDAVVFVADANDSGMNINRSGAGTSVSQKTMTALPTTSRSMNDIMKLTPQASVTSNGLAVGGGNYRSSNVTVDGAAFNNSFGIGSNLPAGGTPISLDAIEQMSVNITPFDVRHSGFTGGAINAVTKRGTNEWHASVYNYFKNDQLIGNRVQDNEVALSQSINNTTGFTVGGPIIKNKLFFFVNAEYSVDKTPGSTKVVRKSESEAWGGSTSKVRPTETFMNEVKDYLAKTYNYDPGRYQGYSLSTPDWKVMARLDWNINNDHKLNLRFSHTKNYYSSSPSNSVNPLYPNPYDRNKLGRTSEYAQFFESSRYFQEQNFTSLSAELNSAFLEGQLNNMFRITWSHQNEPRSFVGDLFPTVDILEQTEDGQRAVITSFGPDPFTYGNLRDVHTVTVTDEVNYTVGINNITAGAQFEWDDTKNGFMQGGAGYYVYNSWDDFKNDRAPAAFAITHSNRDDLKQVYPSFQYMQASLYAQDELNISDYFKLTAGIRFEMPIYPTIPNNENKEYLEKSVGTSFEGTSTADMPKFAFNVSPRIGFNWDILKDRNLVLRGGTGIYTGRIPFVWIVSAAGNSNCLQAQYITSTGYGKAPDGITLLDPNATVSDAPKFHTNINDILNELYKGEFKAKDLAAPQSPTIMAKNLKMPSTWKTSLALDGRIPGGIKASLEGIFNYDINSVYCNKLGQVEVEEGIQLPGEPDVRKLWKSENIKNSQGKAITPYYINNKNLHGYYYSVTAQLQKDFNFGLSLMAAYTYSGSMSISDAIGDQITSAYNTMTYTKNGSNTPELGYSTYVSPNRFIANISYRHEEGRRGATTIGLFYEGFNHFYIGGYSYTRYSYVMDNVTGDGGAQNLIYIPTKEELASMPFSSDDNRAAYESFIAGDKYLSKHRGEYSKRGGAVAPWQNRFNLKVTQDINFNTQGRKLHTIQLGLDINNIANLLNSNWGLTDRMNSDKILTFSDGKYKFTAPTMSKYNGTYSTWNMLLSIRYFF